MVQDMVRIQGAVKVDQRVEITDEGSAFLWLKTQEPQTQGWFVARCALRALPALGDWNHAVSSGLAFSTIRSVFYSVALATCPPANVSNLAKQANDATHSVASDVAFAIAVTDPSSERALNAVRSADVSLSTVTTALASGVYYADLATDSFDSDAQFDSGLSFDSSPMYEAAQQDTAAIMGWQRLWMSTSEPNATIEAWRNLKIQCATDDADWSFWIKWYEGILNGTPMDWDLIFKIATELTEDDWNAGQSRVASRIAEIEANWLVERLPQVSEIYETDDGLYEIRGAVADTSRLMQSVLDRVTFALDTAVQSNMCDLNEMSLACKVLRQALAVGAEDANMVEQYFRRASGLIKAGVSSGKYAEDDETQFLTDILDEMALQLRGDHPEVAAAVATRLTTRLREIDGEKRIRTATLIDDLRDGTGARLHRQLGLAADVTRDGSSAEATADAVKESANSAAKISLLERAKRAESSGPMAVTKMGVRANQLVEWVTTLLSSGG